MFIYGGKKQSGLWTWTVVLSPEVMCGFYLGRMSREQPVAMITGRVGSFRINLQTTAFARKYLFNKVISVTNQVSMW